MVAVKEIAWEEAMSPDFDNPARKAWREAVAEIAEKAKETLPECNGRVDRAVAIVLNGDGARSQLSGRHVEREEGHN